MSAVRRKQSRPSTLCPHGDLSDCGICADLYEGTCDYHPGAIASGEIRVRSYGGQTRWVLACDLCADEAQPEDWRPLDD